MWLTRVRTVFELLLSDYTLRTVCLGTAAIGAVSGALGCFAYLRRQSLMGDVVSHSSLAGILLFFLISYWITGEGSKSMWVLVPGAILSGTAALMLTRTITRRTPLKEDSGLGVMLAIFFGSSILLLRWIQRSTPVIPGRAGLDDYLFGMAAAMGRDDVQMILILGLIAVLVVALLWKQFKVFTFDPDYAHSLGMRTHLLDNLLLVVLVVSIVIGIQAVGVVLMIALLIAPASAARQWCRHLGPMVVLAAVIGAACGAGGSLLSAMRGGLPTGPVIALSVTAVFVISIIIAPRRGVVARALRRRRVWAESVAKLESGSAV